MNTRALQFRRLGVLLVLITLLGGPLLPSESADAAPLRQVPLEGGFTTTLPAPEPAHLIPSTGAQVQAVNPGSLGGNERLPAPLTPQGSPDSASGGSQKTTQITTNALTSTPSPSDFVIYQNSALNSASYPASQIASPAAANESNDIFSTYNNYAALSMDYGSTWTYYDPKNQLDTHGLSWNSLDGGFTGSQDVVFDPTHNVMAWVLHYGPDSITHESSFRLAWTVGQAELEAMSWVSVVIRPPSYCPNADPSHYYQFDQPQLALTANYLYLSSNVYDYTAAQPKCTVLIRLSMSELVAKTSLDIAVFYSDLGFNFTPAQGGTDTLYFARHASTTDLRVYQWPESVNASGVTYTDVTHAAYINTGYNCTVTASSINPCGSDDDRLTAGWVWGVSGATQYLLFTWDAAQGTDGLGTQNYPYVRYVKLTLPLTTPTMSPTTDSGLSDSSRALFFASAARNARGHAGGTVATAGGAYQPGCSAWIEDDYSTGTGGFDFSAVQTGTNSPSTNAWGAYLRTRQSSGNQNQWIGTCYAIESGVVTPRVFRFGRARDGDTIVKIGGVFQGGYNIPSGGEVYPGYPGVVDGPVEVTSIDQSHVFTSERTVYGSSFTELMGYPNDQLTNDYWFTWYDNINMITWVMVGNPSATQTANVDIYIAGLRRNTQTYAIPPGGRITPTFAVVGGPVEVRSDINVFTSERSVYNGSFEEVMGYPNNQLTNDYWFTWYDDYNMITWVLVGNPSTSLTANVDIYVGGVRQNLKTYQISPGQSITPRFGIVGGPVEVRSDINIFTSERSLYHGTFNEVMGYPNNQLTNDYWFTWYDDNNMITWVLVGNPSTSQTANVDIYIGGVKRNAETYQILPGQSVTPTFLGLVNGPVEVRSDINVFTSERTVYGLNSFNETMGYPGNQLTHDYWFTWYDDYNMTTWVLVGKP